MAPTAVTHYIDEAKFSNCVGFIRNKRLLVENNPDKILANVEASNLEEAFWKLSKEEDVQKAGTINAISNNNRSSNIEMKKQERTLTNQRNDNLMEMSRMDQIEEKINFLNNDMIEITGGSKNEYFINILSVDEEDLDEEVTYKGVEVFDKGKPLLPDVVTL